MNVLPHLPQERDGVRIRRLRHNDAEAFTEGTKDEQVRRFGHLPYDEYTPEIVRDQIDGDIDEGLRHGSLAVLAIADAVSDDFLGSIVLFNPRDDRAEVGFWLAPWGRGKGVTRAALGAVSRVAADSGLTALDAKTDQDNIRSRRVLEASGFEQVGPPRTETAPSGKQTRAVTFERPLRPTST
jgi:[ribosomal protein S5]-alanine N-acetyltransferase